MDTKSPEEKRKEQPEVIICRPTDPESVEQDHGVVGPSLLKLRNQTKPRE